MATATPWAILLCKFNDKDSEPFPRTFYEKLFTAAGSGTHNMTDFFRDSSHGAVDTTGSRVFGWYTLPKKRSEYVGSGPNWQGRQDLIDWAKQAATAAGDDLTPFFGVVVCMNVATDLFGGGGPQAVCDPGSMQPSVLGQEMGHGYGLAHSRIDGSEDDYRDPWDVMSTWNSCYMAADANYTLIGPGMNAANMHGRGWLDATRVWRGTGDHLDATIVLRPLHRRDLPGWLAAELPNGDLLEFRMNDGWDAAIPRPAVLAHRFADNHSYLMPATNGGHDLVAGDVYDRGTIGISMSTQLTVTVDAIDPKAQTATIHVVYNAAYHRIPELVGRIFGGVAAGGDGWVWLNGKIIQVPPHGPAFRIIEQLALYQSPELERMQPALRAAIRREALSAIGTEIAALNEEVEPFHTPPPIVKQ